MAEEVWMVQTKKRILTESQSVLVLTRDGQNYQKPRH